MIQDWKNQPEKRFSQLDTFVRSLKQQKGKNLDDIAEKTHHKVFSKLDCLDCANCCKSIPPIVNQTDQTRIAKHLKLSVSEFHNKYITVDEDNDQVMNASPCPFLNQDHSCSIYEVRPKACRAYPHTDHYEFSKNIQLHAVNSRYCPAVFHILDRMRSLIKK